MSPGSAPETTEPCDIPHSSDLMPADSPMIGRAGDSMATNTDAAGLGESAMDKIYQDGDYQAHNPSWHVEDSPWKAQQIEIILRRNKVVVKSICEVGCGAGEILARLAKAFPSTKFYGYDISPQAFALCQPRESDQLHFYLKDLLAETDTFFDLLLAIDVFEHIEDYLGFLKRLKDRGSLKIFHIPLDLSLQSLFRVTPILSDRRAVGHIHYFFKDTALATLQDCGYKVLDYIYTPRRLELPNLSLSARLLKFPRKLLFKISPDFAVRALGGYSLLVLAQ
jgi:SAM-dependent methyltransferase